ncbi:MAG: hypothetical protein V4543_14980 [Bacteroidota bacterium]
MALADELLFHAEKLIKVSEDSLPSQADLRRSVSASYYSVFHLLLSEGADLLLKNPEIEAVRELAQRSVTHSQMKNVCMYLAKPYQGLPEKLRRFAPEPNPAEIMLIAKSFGNLQALRLKADYQIKWEITNNVAQDAVYDAKEVFSNWQLLKTSRPEAALRFVSILLFFDRYQN